MGHKTEGNTSFILAHGNYKELFSYRKSVIIYDATVFFCKSFLDKRDRTVDQMVQAARSGKQNIVEGCMASGTSKENESYETYREFIETRPPEIVANILICIINQCNYLLDHQLKRLERDFLNDGGLRERMYNARENSRKNK